MNVPELIDEIDRLQNKRNKIIAMFDDQIKILRGELEGVMKAAGIDEAVGTHGARAKLNKVQDVKIKDWSKFYQWMSKSKAWDVLIKRVAPTAVLARIKAGEDVPEVVVETREILVVTTKKGDQS